MLGTKEKNSEIEYDKHIVEKIRKNISSIYLKRGKFVAYLEAKMTERCAIKPAICAS